MNAARVISDYNELAENLAQEEKEEMIQRARDYNTELYNTSGSFEHPEKVDGYLDILDITGTGIMGYIEIEKIGVNLPIYHTVCREAHFLWVGRIPIVCCQATGDFQAPSCLPTLMNSRSGTGSL